MATTTTLSNSYVNKQRYFCVVVIFLVSLNSLICNKNCCVMVSAATYKIPPPLSLPSLRSKWLGIDPQQQAQGKQHVYDQKDDTTATNGSQIVSNANKDYNIGNNHDNKSINFESVVDWYFELPSATREIGSSQRLIESLVGYTTYPKDQAGFDAATAPCGTKSAPDYIGNPFYSFGHTYTGQQLSDQSDKEGLFVDFLDSSYNTDNYICANGVRNCGGSFTMDFSSAIFSGGRGVYGLGFNYGDSGATSVVVTFGDDSVTPPTDIPYEDLGYLFFGITSDKLIKRITIVPTNRFFLYTLTLGDICSQQPSLAPSNSPSEQPSEQPNISLSPSKRPSTLPSVEPSERPSTMPVVASKKSKKSASASNKSKSASNKSMNGSKKSTNASNKSTNGSHKSGSMRVRGSNTSRSRG